ncbi:MAG: hypothetical protein RSD49_08435 [Hafnia sp.]
MITEIAIAKAHIKFYKKSCKAFLLASIVLAAIAIALFLNGPLTFTVPFWDEPIHWYYLPRSLAFGSLVFAFLNYRSLLHSKRQLKIYEPG